MRSAVYEPRGPWGAFINLSPSQIKQINAAGHAADGSPWKPDLVKRLPSYPSGRPALFPFWQPIMLSKEHPEINGKPRPFMRAGSPIDSRPGVYFIWNAKNKTMYIGSSIGESRQGNVRRTIARHWQSWNRNKALSDYVTKFKGKGAVMQQEIEDWRHKGGVTVSRTNIYVSILLIDNDDKRISKAYSGNGSNLTAPRQVEAWYFEHICDRLRCAGVNQIARIERDQPDRQLETVPF